MADTRTEANRLPRLTPAESALVYSVVHDENLLLARVFAYLHWSKARGELIDAPCQSALPVVDDAQAVVDEQFLLHPNPTWDRFLGLDDEDDGRIEA